MESTENIGKIFEFLHLVRRLKTTYRFGADKNSKGDSSADHSWRLALMVFIIAEELRINLDLLKAVKIALIHDLAESITGDIDARLVKDNIYSKEDKQFAEEKAMKKFVEILPENIGQEIYDLWSEYENMSTPEACYVKVLDKVETLMHILELGHPNYTDSELIGTYGNDIIEKAPELKEVFLTIKREIKEEFQKGNIPWKEEYDTF